LLPRVGPLRQVNWRTSDEISGLVSIDSDGMIRLWDVEKGKEIWSVVGFAKAVGFVADGKEVVLVRGWHRPRSKDYDVPWVEYRDASNGKLLREVKPKGS
jgi:WD40 repeat protein